jgi:hydrogenase expression/formation protein HypD
MAGDRPDPAERLSARYADFDAELRFEVSDIRTEESSLCRSGEVLQGLITPPECAAFGTECTPRHPLGAPMVSSEGACAAYHAFRRLDPSVTSSA